MIRTYKELIKLSTFDERFEYLKINGQVGVDTFGFDRIFNQMFYKSIEYQSVRNYVITRDQGFDLGIVGRGVYRPLVHHMNPISINDIKNSTDFLLNPDYLITTQLSTHNAIHYGDKSLLLRDAPVERTKFDTCPWRQ